jgi:hypothetical protein
MPSELMMADIERRPTNRGFSPATSRDDVPGVHEAVEKENLNEESTKARGCSTTTLHSPGECPLTWLQDSTIQFQSLQTRSSPLATNKAEATEKKPPANRKPPTHHHRTEYAFAQRTGVKSPRSSSWRSNSNTNRCEKK